MMKKGLLKELECTEEFFKRSTSCLKEKDSSYAPNEDMLNVAHQVAHTAQTIDWFLDGMLNPKGFDMDFDKHWDDVKPCESLDKAKEWFTNSIAKAKKVVSEMSDEDLLSPLPEGPVMGGAPKLTVIGAISEHTAHHRGALTVYSRLLGYKPSMPYMD